MSNGGSTLFDDSAKARRTDPATSHSAAASVARIRESQARILALLGSHGPMTDEAIFAALQAAGCQISPSGARTRRKELLDKGLVKDTGARELTKAKRQTIVWAACEKETK